MKSLEELKARYHNIPELPVSEEMLCARSEGKLSPIEEMEVDLKISQDSRLQDLVNEIAESNGSPLINLDDWITSQEINNLPEMIDVPVSDDSLFPFELNKKDYLIPNLSSPSTDTPVIDSDIFSQSEDIFHEEENSFENNDMFLRNIDSFDLDDIDTDFLDSLDDF